MSRINWHSDLEQVRKELPRLHPDFFSAKNEAEFHARLDQLQNNAENMDTYSIVMEIARIVGTAKDAHTAVMLPQNYRLPFDCYPFAEGLYITATDSDHKELLHSRIESIGGHETATILARMSEIIPHENRQFVLSSLPSFVICADILYGVGLITSPEETVVTVASKQGKIFERTIKTLPYDDYQALPDPSHNMPLYRQHRDKYYWSSFDNGLLYINYSKCKNMEDIAVGGFAESLRAELSANKGIRKIVIDLRHNRGGNSELFRPFLAWLCREESLNQRGKLFVLVGRDTFSSAALNAYYLKFNTKALFVGEPTGAKPNHFGEVQYLELESSGLLIRYSTKYYELIEDDAQQSLVPDIECEVSFKDYSQGIDSFLAAVVAGK
ncbi:MAG: hypothetical protein KGZ92_06225 [Firmicutes bacterium]|nr:hypothetical protein [Dethiobacter sp.]MBS3888881.1 hypothetical protein [Bacillota bacterium]MBS4054311.1 hypothetical protein [Thermaerobacter sp.]